MSWKVARRGAGYLLLGILLALGMLAVESYPGERTWVDAVAERHREWNWDREFSRREVRVDCGWRTLWCEELPDRKGPLAAIADSALSGVDFLLCARSIFPPFAGLAALSTARPSFCSTDTSGNPISLTIQESGVVFDVTRFWRVASSVEDLGSRRAALELRLGPSERCAYRSDTGPVLFYWWQRPDYNIRIEASGDHALYLQYALGRVHCDE